MLIHNYRWREFPDQVEPNNGDTGFMFGLGHGDLVEIAPLVLRAATVITREKYSVKPVQKRHGGGKCSPQGIIALNICVESIWHI